MSEAGIVEVKDLKILSILVLDPFVGLILRVDTNRLLHALFKNNRILYRVRITWEAVEGPLFNLDLVAKDFVEIKIVTD